MSCLEFDNFYVQGGDNIVVSISDVNWMFGSIEIILITALNISLF